MFKPHFTISHPWTPYKNTAKTSSALFYSSHIYRVPIVQDFQVKKYKLFDVIQKNCTNIKNGLIECTDSLDVIKSNQKSS